MNVAPLERRINRELKALNHAYAISNLRRLSTGEYWFDLAISFNSPDLAKVNRIFRAHLGPSRKARKQTVQAKFYLTPETCQRLRRRAAERGVAQSALVEEALQSVLAS
jgi:hypothetical protein